jgi:hypothetical protein
VGKRITLLVVAWVSGLALVGCSSSQPQSLPPQTQPATQGTTSTQPPPSSTSAPVPPSGAVVSINDGFKVRVQARLVWLTQSAGIEAPPGTMAMQVNLTFTNMTPDRPVDMPNAAGVGSLIAKGSFDGNGTVSNGHPVVTYDPTGCNASNVYQLGTGWCTVPAQSLYYDQTDLAGPTLAPGASATAYIWIFQFLKNMFPASDLEFLVENTDNPAQNVVPVS